MVTLAQRITELREEKELSRPALAQALGLPKLVIEKFETGRLTPGQASHILQVIRDLGEKNERECR